MENQQTLIFLIKKIDAVDHATENRFSKTESDELIEYAQEIKNIFKEKKPDLTLNFSISKNYEKTKIITTNEADLKENKTGFTFIFSAPIPGGGSELYRFYESDSFF